LLANDHLHYSAEAHAVWAKKTADLIKQIIRK
jgi:lysophospholipase L1-like esterase